MRVRALLGLAVFVAVIATGCGSSGTQRVPVTGTVTFRGDPLADGSITFDPVDPKLGSMSGGVVKDGAYSIPAESGLLPGRYTVRISAPIPGTRAGDLPGSVRLAKERLPAKYNSQSTLTADVPAAGGGPLDFKLD